MFRNMSIQFACNADFIGWNIFQLHVSDFWMQQYENAIQ